MAFSTWELAHWQALIALDGPFMPQRIDVLSSLNCVASSMMASKTKPDDWLPQWEGIRKVEYQAGIEAFLAAHGG